MKSCKKASNAAVVRVHKTKNYTTISNHHLYKRDLSLKSKGLMCLFLALPDDWNYSINGLAAINSDGIDSIKSAIKELKITGYLSIEHERNTRGQFDTIYHIFENPRENTFLTAVENPPRKNRDGKTVMEKPLRKNRDGLTVTGKPIQLNTKTNILKLKTKTKELKQNTNNETLKIASDFDALSLFNLFKEICVSFPQPNELSDARLKKATTRIAKKPKAIFWETVFKKAENSEFCKQSNWFSFDWVIKNDENPLKVFEGNYDGKKENKKPVDENQKCEAILHFEAIKNQVITPEEEAKTREILKKARKDLKLDKKNEDV